jgi:hypothetical protein
LGWAMIEMPAMDFARARRRCRCALFASMGWAARELADAGQRWLRRLRASLTSARADASAARFSCCISGLTSCGTRGSHGGLDADPDLSPMIESTETSI